MKNKIGAILLITTLAVVAFTVWVFSGTNTNKAEVFVKTGDNSDSLFLNLVKSGGLKKIWTFDIVKSIMQMDKIYPGKYQISRYGLSGLSISLQFQQPMPEGNPDTHHYLLARA